MRARLPGAVALILLGLWGCDDGAGVGQTGLLDATPVEGGCAADTDCPAGAFCDAGECAPGCRQAPDDCPSGSRCDDDRRCVPTGGCLPAEICGNGVDDDCNGIVDDPLVCRGCVDGTACDTGVPGRCADGKSRCVGGEAVCEPLIQPRAERCNALDDDCDGQIDEDFPDLGEACPDGRGICAGTGRWACNEENGLAVCAGHEAAARAEICNGRDDDCDGQVDEDADGAGDPCVDGVGQCAVTGERACLGADGLACTATAGAPSPEICDGLDNDCDGLVDELWPRLGEACGAGAGVCAREGRVVCAGLTTRCEVEEDAEGEPPVEPTEEICNGLDDDCDGQVDEGEGGEPLREVCYGGPEGTGGVGPCAAGVRVCAEGELGPCEGDVLPSPEVCDGSDNDCNGLVDDDGAGAPLSATCYTGPDGTEDVGQCVSGAAQCVFGGLTACRGQVLPGVEICDLVDNDCDGRVDEDVPGGCDCEPGAEQACYPGAPGTAGVGLCREGTQRCRDDGEGWLPCEGAVVPADEVCDGVDNDCDGRSDEGVAGVGGICRLGDGDCDGQGRLRCDGEGGLSCDAEPVAPRDELCNGRDDDCDGRVDEDYPLVGQPCTAGRGACLVTAEHICGAGGLLAVCPAEPGDPSVEICNGIDDDCDGLVDEDFGGGVGCALGEGQCRRNGVTVCVDPNEPAVCNAEPGPASPELCNGRDDDCDGRVDEDFRVGEPCEVGAGVCFARGIIECSVQGRAFCDAPEVAGVPEVCNGADDDCDGEVDEGLEELGACDAGGRGVCGPGRLACREAGVRCVPRVEAGPEVCDGLDNDCDGEIDEELGTIPCGVGICARDLPRCDQGRLTVCVPRAGALPVELCNRLDDDCDGAVDELVPGDGGPCGAGLGACLGTGIQRCAAAQMTCDAVAGAPSPESCNGVDDDCDGRVDEGAFGPADPCTVGVGACRAPGVLNCAGGQARCLGQPGAPTDEACNGVDDDCDGRVDEGLGGALCGVGACARELPSCDGGEPPECEPLVGASPEVCNGIDDDCDGVVDEAPEGVGAACQAGLGQCRAPGVTACVGGALVCDAPVGEPGPELCNGVDDDCDGLIDERPVDAGGGCAAGVGGCERLGVIQCVNAALRCSATAGGPSPEVCNGADDDCDGRTDEGLGAFACGQGICRRDLAACVDGAPPECDPLVGAQPRESCNGQDDDCDGRVDEGAMGVGVRCTAGTGQCRRSGETQCVAGGLACDATPGAPAPELCDLLDNDCDGQVDEGLNVGAVCTRGLGQCAAEGIIICDGQGGTRCDALPQNPAVEICDGLDNDCDGFVDEGLDDLGFCAGELPGVCNLGRLRCADAALRCVTEVEPSAEICDGLDNDCDGQIDEGFGTIECGLGLCRHEVRVCDLGRPGVCDPLRGADERELCNGLDDDCDGRMDEDAVGHDVPCAAGVGACRRVGTQLCQGGALRCDAAAGAPQPERCNLVDDDCDGRIDEDPIGDNQPCGVGVGACRREAIATCEAGALRCPAVAGAPSPEVCDGVDNDCDGDLDEGFDPVVCGVGVCRRVVSTCDGGEVGACDPLLGATAEVCNGLDDDCDGRVDEEVAGVGEGCRAGVGECQRDGSVVCAGGALGCDAVPGEPAEEICDARDNDCDGQTDEDAAGVGDPCAEGEGTCVAIGVFECFAGLLRCDAEPDAAAPEACNGIDDDCDGRVDEALGTVTCGQGACLKTIDVCQDGALVNCDPMQGQSPEICNGIDDDCDGVVDEGQPMRDCGVGICQREEPVCVGGRVTVCQPRLGAGPEVCDGRDNDCDGLVDNDPVDANIECREGVGACARLGMVHCEGGVARCDAVPGLPEPERCNGRDDDCDGSIDEGELPDVGQPCERGVGACRRTALTVCADGFEECLAVPGAPTPETCNRVDDDCDGLVDEAAGGPDCNGNGVADTCDVQFRGDCNFNGLPDDCDIASGRSQDCNFDGIPDECPADSGGCAPDVTPPFVELFVSAEAVLPGTPVQIRVTAIDDRGIFRITAIVNFREVPLDANGEYRFTLDEPGLYAIEAFAQDVAGNSTTVEKFLLVLDPIDDEPPHVAITSPEEDAIVGGLVDVEGTAADGNLLRWTLSYGPVDDPDRVFVATDTVPVLNGRLGTMDLGGVGVGLYLLRLTAVDLNGQQREVLRTFRVVVCEPQAELCNGKDDDCDGRIDEGFGGAEGVGAACAAGVGGCRRAGTIACTADGFGAVCDAVPGQPTAEICDALVDADCDGDPLNGYDVGGSCAVGLGVCEAEGSLVCAPTRDRTICNAAPLANAGPEACNGLDDDCDGHVDEDFADSECGVGACFRRLASCGGAPPVCDPLLGASPETCNGVDDDCDGRVDENAALPPGPCFAGVGACRREGARFCEDGRLGCSAVPGAPQPEVCNGADDDCDGQIDESVNCGDVTPPVITLTITPNPALPGQQVLLRMTAVDAGGILGDRLIVVDDLAFIAEPNGEVTFVPPAPGRYDIEAIASDTFGNVGSLLDHLWVSAPDDLDAPVVQITAPLNGAVVNAPVPIRATVNDANLVEYVLEIASAGQDDWAEFGRGSEPVVDAVIGVIQPGELPAGAYRVRVRAEDANRRVGLDEIAVELAP